MFPILVLYSIMANILNNRGGLNRNNLLNLLKDLENYEEMVSICSESPYIETEHVSAYLQKFKNYFTLLDINIQSLNAKFDSFVAFLNNLSDADIYFSAICIQETWLKTPYDSNCFNIPNYNMFTLQPTCTTHGGLIIYVHEKFQVKELNLYKESTLWEGLFLELSGGGLTKKLNLCNIYRPPRDRNDEIDRFLSEFTPTVSAVTNSTGECLIAGDFNLDLLKIESRATYSKYLELMYCFSLKPTVTLPTRLSRRNATLIDHIFCKSSSVNTSGGIIISNISDHLMPFLCLDITKEFSSPPKTISFQPSDARSVNAFVSAVNEIDFKEHFQYDINRNANHGFDVFKEQIDSCINKFIPYKTVKFKRYKHKIRPWITSGILISIKKRDKMYKHLKEIDPNSNIYDSYKCNLQTYNTIIKKLLRNAKFSYYNNMFLKYKNDSRKSWSLINTLIGNSSSKKNITNIFTVNGIDVSNESVIADNFNSFFSDIGRRQADSIPSFPDNHFAKYLHSPASTEFIFQFVNECDVLKVLSTFKSKSSAGDDNLSLKLLKLLKHKLASPLTALINQSLHQGIFPEALKLAKIIPLFKKGDVSCFNNYRPISLLLSISKVYEKIVHNQLLSYFTVNKLFFDHQYGFRPLHSTESACLELVDRIFSLLDEDKIPFAIFMDLSKAFDTLNHDILLHKLSYYGVKHNSLSWFESYLTNRKQYVSFNNHKSNTSHTSLGVPQGSILGPLLFLIYVNDAATVSPLFKCILYADDTTLISTFCSASPAQLLNNELNNVFLWLCSNKLSLNVAKTKYMVFHSPNMPPPNFPDLHINNSILERVHQFNFLGINLSSALSWKTHQSHICKKLSRAVGILKRLQNMVPSTVLLNIYNSLFLSHISHSVLVWGHKSDRIFKLQKKAIRIVFKCKYNAHTSGIFKKYKLLKFEDVYKNAAAKFFYKYSNNLLPTYFDNMFDNIPLTHNYNTRQLIPRPQMSKKKFTSFCIRFLIPKCIAELPHNITAKISTHSLSSFGYHTKNFYYSKYNEICTLRHCYVCGT